MTLRILVIGGGPSAEHDVSRHTAESIADALHRLRYRTDVVTIGRDGRWNADDHPLGPTVTDSVANAVPLIAAADVVFPAVHGVGGEDGTLPALCSLLRKRTVGSGLRPGAICIDKWVTKLVAGAVGVRTAGGRLIRSADLSGIEYEAPVVVKPVSAGSSYGVSVAESVSSLLDALLLAARFDDRILVEPVQHGREVDIAVIKEADGTRWATPALEIRSRGIFDTTTKYDGFAPFVVPASLTAAEAHSLRSAALTMFDALDCAGVARIDFFLTADGPVLNEVNTLPGMTPESQVPRMFEAVGVGYDELIARLVAGAAAAR